MNATENIARILRRAISKGEYKLGSRLKEKNLAEKYNTSRTPVREALKLLEKEGLVSNKPYSGFRVMNPTFNDLKKAFEMITILEVGAARLACFNPDKDEIIIKLEENYYLTEKAANENNFDLVIELNSIFHRLIDKASDNPYLISNRERMHYWVLPFQVMLPYFSWQVEVTLEDHPKIINAIKTNNVALAELTVREHKEQATSQILSFFKEMKK